MASHRQDASLLIIDPTWMKSIVQCCSPPPNTLSLRAPQQQIERLLFSKCNLKNSANNNEEARIWHSTQAILNGGTFRPSPPEVIRFPFKSVTSLQARPSFYHHPSLAFTRQQRPLILKAKTVQSF